MSNSQEQPPLLLVLILLAGVVSGLVLVALVIFICKYCLKHQYSSVQFKRGRSVPPCGSSLLMRELERKNSDSEQAEYDTTQKSAQIHASECSHDFSSCDSYYAQNFANECNNKSSDKDVTQSPDGANRSVSMTFAVQLDDNTIVKPLILNEKEQQRQLLHHESSCPDSNYSHHHHHLHSHESISLLGSTKCSSYSTLINTTKQSNQIVKKRNLFNEESRIKDNEFPKFAPRRCSELLTSDRISKDFDEDVKRKRSAQTKAFSQEARRKLFQETIYVKDDYNTLKSNSNRRHLQYTTSLDGMQYHPKDRHSGKLPLTQQDSGYKSMENYSSPMSPKVFSDMHSSTLFDTEHDFTPPSIEMWRYKCGTSPFRETEEQFPTDRYQLTEFSQHFEFERNTNAQHEASSLVEKFASSTIKGDTSVETSRCSNEPFRRAKSASMRRKQFSYEKTKASPKCHSFDATSSFNIESLHDGSNSKSLEEKKENKTTDIQGKNKLTKSLFGKPKTLNSVAGNQSLLIDAVVIMAKIIAPPVVEASEYESSPTCSLEPTISRDYSIDAKTNEIFEEFMRDDPRFDKHNMEEEVRRKIQARQRFAQRRCNSETIDHLSIQSSAHHNYSMSHFESINARRSYLYNCNHTKSIDEEED